MSLQQEFEKELSPEIDGYQLLSEYINKISNNDNEKDIANNLTKIDNINIPNIYLEYNVRRMINTMNKVKFSDIIYLYVIRYHPRLYDLIFNGLSINEYEERRTNLIKLNEEKHILDNVAILSQEINNTPVTSMEYFYYLSWITKFDYETIHCTYNELHNNVNDVLAINVSYGLKDIETIIKYNKLVKEQIMILTKKLVENTKRYDYVKVQKSNEYYNLYDHHMNEIHSLTTPEITVILDYNNGYVTQCGIVNNDFALSMLNRNILCIQDKTYWTNIITFDFYKHLPPSCYHDKLDKSLLKTTIIQIRQIAAKNYVEHNREQTVMNILGDDDLKKVLHEQEIPIFEMYLKYYKQLEDDNIEIFITYCTDYFLENYMEHSSLLF